MIDTDTDAGPTEGPWEVRALKMTNYGVVGPERKVCNVSFYSRPENKKNAELIAAAGTAAHELDDEYDPVETLGILSELVQHAEDLMPLLEIQSSIDHTTLQDLLQKARRDDE